MIKKYHECRLRHQQSKAKKVNKNVFNELKKM